MPAGADALALLDYCLRGEPAPDPLLDRVVTNARTAEGSRALFALVIERLGDLFEPHLCDAYAAAFSRIVERIAPEHRAVDLESRYHRIRLPRPVPENVRRVVVLSRVTLGADVAVTSVLLRAAIGRYPQCEIVFAGPAKNYALFAGEARLRHLEIDYGRGATLAERLAVSFQLRPLLDDPSTLVIDPDSRLTQLGLIPVCAEDRYLYFESRAFGAGTDLALPELASRWAEENLGVAGAEPWLAPLPVDDPAAAAVTVSLGVGENPAKRVPDPFELLLLKHLASRSDSVLVDEGASGEERGRVERALQPGMRTWRGAFAPFAYRITGSRLYVGYDSAGQHVAAAAGVPLVCVFAGHVSERMFTRWKPTGRGPIVILRGDRPDVLPAAKAAIDQLLAR
jgi:hypothetical protein